MFQLHVSYLQAAKLLKNAKSSAKAEDFNEQAHGAFAAAAFPGLPKTKADLIAAARFLRQGVKGLRLALAAVEE